MKFHLKLLLIKNTTHDVFHEPVYGKDYVQVLIELVLHRDRARRRTVDPVLLTPRAGPSASPSGGPRMVRWLLRPY